MHTGKLRQLSAPSSTAPRKAKPRRMNVQAMDQETAHARLILKASVRTTEYARSIGDATRLLKMRIHRKDVSAMTGVTLTQLDTLAKATNATQTTGSKVKRLGLIVHSADEHMKASAFLVFLEAAITADENLALTSEVFLAAIDAYATLWHHDILRIPYTLYHCLAQRFVEKRVHLSDCPRCGTRFLQLPFEERDATFNLEGDCPKCRLLTSIMSARPQIQNGVPVMKSVSRIHRTIYDPNVTGKAHRMVMVGDGSGTVPARSSAASRSKDRSWWEDDGG